MSGKRYTNEFKEEAIKQVIERGYTVREVAQRLDVSAHSLYEWVRAARGSSNIIVTSFPLFPCAGCSASTGPASMAGLASRYLTAPSRIGSC